VTATILDVMAAPKVFGRAFAGPSWDTWRAALAALFGLPLTRTQWAVYQHHTGRSARPVAPAREGWIVVGRRGGKSRIAALVAVYLATFRDYTATLAPGEKGTVMLIATDRAQARTLMRYILGLLDAVPTLAALVTRRTRETVELSNSIVIEIHTASFRSTRGYTVVAAVLDEIAFLRDETSANPDVELITALRPAMATVPGALLLAISSPYARRGALWQAYRDHYGKDGDPVLVWQAPTMAMNPRVDPSIVGAAYDADEATADAEYGAQFRRDLDGFVPREVIQGCTVEGRAEVGPLSTIRYAAFVDPAGGSGTDSMTLAIAHPETRGGRRVVVLDAVRERKPRFSPEAVVQDFADLLHRYRITTVVGDRYAGEWPREQFRKRGIEYTPAAKPKSDLYRDALPLLNSGLVELLDIPRLASQFGALERRTGGAGRDSIDHAPGQHDDVANAVAGVLTLAETGAAAPRIVLYSSGMDLMARPDDRPAPEYPDEIDDLAGLPEVEVIPR
jgi:hypothetical protein